MTDCNELDILALLDGELDEEAIAHLASCADCREELERVKRLVRQLDVFFSEEAGGTCAADHDALLREFGRQELKIEERPLPAPLLAALEAFRERALQTRTAAAFAKVLGKASCDDEVVSLWNALKGPHRYAAAAAPKDLLKPGKWEDGPGAGPEPTDEDA